MAKEGGNTPVLTVYYESEDLGGVSAVIDMVTIPTAMAIPTVLISRNCESLQRWHDNFRAKDITVINSALRNRLQLLGWLDFPNLLRSIKVIRKSKLLHCHLHTPFSSLPIIILTGIFARTKIVTTEHYVTQLNFLRRRKLSPVLSIIREMRIAVLMFLKKISFRFIDRIVTVSESNRRFMIETFGRKIEHKLIMIANGIDTDQYNENSGSVSDSDPRLQGNSRVITVVAGLNNQKGHEYLFRAVPAIVAKLPSVKILLVGDGHLRNYLKELAASLGIADYIIFMGFRSDVREILRSSDLFVLPSIFEGMPLSVIEAMASGKAVVATKVDGTADLVVDGITGYLVPPKDPEKLAEKIIELMENDEKRREFGKAGRERALQYFSANRMFKEYEALYNELVPDLTAV